MNDLNIWELNSSIEHNFPIPHDFVQAASEVCEKALNGARRQLHPLLRRVDLNRLDHRGEFLQAFKSALEKRTARKLAAWLPDIQPIFRFDETRITNVACWDSSIHLLVKVSRLLNTVEIAGRELDHSLVGYLARINWQRFRIHRSVLDVQQVTISELRHAVGYGAMFCAVYTVPVQVRPRERQIG